MIYDLIYRQNKGLSIFLNSRLSRVCFFESTVQKETNVNPNNGFTKWYKIHPPGGFNKQRATNLSKVNNYKHRTKIKAKFVSIPYRVRSRDASKTSIKLRKYSSLFK